jgi:hypothetical protein
MTGDENTEFEGPFDVLLAAAGAELPSEGGPRHGTADDSTCHHAHANHDCGHDHGAEIEVPVQLLVAAALVLAAIFLARRRRA